MGTELPEARRRWSTRGSPRTLTSVYRRHFSLCLPHTPTTHREQEPPD